MCNNFHIHDSFKIIAFSLESVSLHTKNNSLLSLLLNRCKLCYFTGYRCLNLIYLCIHSIDIFIIIIVPLAHLDMHDWVSTIHPSWVYKWRSCSWIQWCQQFITIVKGKWHFVVSIYRLQVCWKHLFADTGDQGPQNLQTSFSITVENKHFHLYILMKSFIYYLKLKLKMKEEKQEERDQPRNQFPESQASVKAEILYHGLTNSFCETDVSKHVWIPYICQNQPNWMMFIFYGSDAATLYFGFQKRPTAGVDKFHCNRTLEAPEIMHIILERNRFLDSMISTSRSPWSATHVHI